MNCGFLQQSTIAKGGHAYGPHFFYHTHSTPYNSVTKEKIEQEAQRLGVVVRQCIVDIHTLVWTLVLGFQTGSRRFIATLH